MVGGRPICANGWDDMDAKVACREKGFGRNTKGIATNNGHFGTAAANFIISEVACESANEKLRDCPHKTRNICPSGGVAGAVCVDPEKLTLVNQNQATNQGNVILHGKYPVCSNNWDKKDAQVVCNSLYREKFQDRDDKQVPVFEATVNSDFGQAPSNHYIMANVQCQGNENWLTDCQANYFPLANDHNNCQKAAGVKCAKCTVTDLKNIIESIKENAAFSEVKQSVRDAFAKLKTECHRWECIPGQKQEYPEYCLAYQFLQSFANIVKETTTDPTTPAQKLRPLSLKFDMIEQINYLKSDSDAQKIQSSIGDLAEQTAAFQTQLGDYFIKMAKYDEAKNVADFKLARQIWIRQRQRIYQLLDKMEPGVKELFAQAFISAGLRAADKAAGLFLAIKATIRPADAVLNGGEMAAALNDIRVAAGEVADAAATLVGLKYTFSNTIPKFFELVQEISEDFQTNKEMSKVMTDILKIDEVSDFTVEDANNFLYYYEEFSPSITTEQLALFKSLLTEMIDSACDVVLAEGAGALAAGVRIAFVKVCPEIKRDRDVLIDLVSAIKDSELDLNFNVYAALAKSKLAINEAETYKQVSGQSTMKTIRNAIAGKKGYVLYQLQKLDVINGACDLVKYRNYGKEENYCVQLRANPNGGLDQLLSGLAGSNRDMCDQTKAATVNIPARFRKGDEKLPDGTLDLSILFDTITAPSVPFQIPNTQWLVDNGWLDEAEADNGPFYLKRFELFLPAWYGKSKLTVHTELGLVKNTLEPNGDMYNFDEDVNYVLKYTDYNPGCGNTVENPYNTDGCNTKAPRPCILTPGVKNQQKVYPSLMSLWNFLWRLPRTVRGEGVIPYSASGDFKLKARVEICFKGSSSGKREVEETEKRWAIACCAENDPPQVASTGFQCQDCPPGSSPRLVGYYCELCPAGYEPRSRLSYEKVSQAFGCQPCRPKFFKASAGNSPCQSCPSTNANQYGATQCLD